MMAHRFNIGISVDCICGFSSREYRFNFFRLVST
ncbi:unnamed protein product [Schistosoma curassoni]|uniref:Uncharacterized protein n=1 Tax=Schistosoma curassoni TaxID=6186 RepID=A0A183KHR1_9TREM|nr:unnamed protein product [Schistosoma curassoni]